MLIATALQFILVAAIVVYLVLNLLCLVRVQAVTAPLPDDPFVSVCVPARNEARDIGNCLRSLLWQDYPRFEVIMVDDHSTDATLAIAQGLADPRLTVAQSAPLPEGWLGKPHALHQAYQMAKGEVLLFTDADPVFRPHALASAVRRLRADNLDLLTLMPEAEFGSFWERAVQPVIFAMIAGLSRFGRIADARYPDAMGVGAFLMFRRAAYERVGGHERVKGEIVEDVALAVAAKREGLKMLLAEGRALFSIRMYHSLGEIWRGWRKNVFIAMERSVARTLFYALVILPGFWITPYLGLAGDIAAAVTPVPWLGMAFASWCMALGAGIRLCDELGLSRRTVLLFPLGAVVASAVMLDSMTRILVTGQTHWRGRNYPA